MKLKSFIKILNKEKIEYSITADNKIIIGGGNVILNSLTSLPEGVKFNNGDDVYLSSLTSLPKGMKFNNGGNVDLRSLTSLPEGTVFNNGGSVCLDSLTSLPEGVKFNNGDDVYLSSLTSLPEGTEFNNGGIVWLESLTSLPQDVEFNNGGYIRLKSGRLPLKGPYLKRHKVFIDNGHVILYKRVSRNFKTQEGTNNETLWAIGSTLEHPNWNPTLEECGAGKFHACAKPSWCDYFRSKKGDRYIAIKINVNDLYEWPKYPNFHQKIGFRKGTVMYECDRSGRKIDE